MSPHLDEPFTASPTSLGPASLRSVANVLDTLVGDALAKQQALERLQRSLDVAEGRREAAACRIADLQGQNR